MYAFKIVESESVLITLWYNEIKGIYYTFIYLDSQIYLFFQHETLIKKD